MKRLDIDYIDVLQCHRYHIIYADFEIRNDLWFKRFDPETPIEETVRSSLASMVAKL